MKSPYPVIFLGLACPSVLGMVDDETVRGLTAQSLGPCREPGSQNDCL